MEIRHGSLLPSVRQAAAVEMIEKKGRVTVEELAEKFYTSQETVRRDLSTLAEAGHIRKVHGGAVKIALAVESPFEERLKKNLRAKQEIAEKIARLVRPGQSIMMDTGSTTLTCAEALARVRDLTVITNSTKIAKSISSAQNGSVAILLGGCYSRDCSQTVGAQTCAQIARYRTDHVILTISALDHLGAYDFMQDEAQVASAMVEFANELTIVADCSKLEQSSKFRICELRRIGRLVLEDKPTPGLEATLAAAQIEVL